MASAGGSFITQYIRYKPLPAKKRKTIDSHLPGKIVAGRNACAAKNNVTKAIRTNRD